MANTVSGRRRIANDTLFRTPSIIASTPGGSGSIFYQDANCPALDDSSRLEMLHGPSRVTVVNADSFTAARSIIRRDPAALSKVAVLSLASDQRPAGGWLETLSRTQEEALCYSSTLYHTLRPDWYPWPNLGSGSVAGIFSPTVVVFKDDLDHDCVDLPIEDQVVVSVITVAAPCQPVLTPDSFALQYDRDVRDFKAKIRLVLRIAARNGQNMLVLGAMGCGVYGCPPRFVASMMRSILLEGEFKGYFKEVIFAIYSSKSNGPSNFQIFSDILKDLEINR
ncbi:hypothetical protein JB92DRAFT_3081493 [Gautieria morchelliformis]|nr:hypothetical protein JB92DRAFT_3081493 [Gautieria morchelliformis]